MVQDLGTILLKTEAERDGETRCTSHNELQITRVAVSLLLQGAALLLA